MGTAMHGRDAILAAAGAGPRSAQVYLVLLAQADAAGRVETTMDQLADTINTQRSTVYRALRELRARRVVHRVSRTRRGAVYSLAGFDTDDNPSASLSDPQGPIIDVL